MERELAVLDREFADLANYLFTDPVTGEKKLKIDKDPEKSSEILETIQRVPLLKQIWGEIRLSQKVIDYEDERLNGWKQTLSQQILNTLPLLSNRQLSIMTNKLINQVYSTYRGRKQRMSSKRLKQVDGHMPQLLQKLNRNQTIPGLTITEEMVNLAFKVKVSKKTRGTAVSVNNRARNWEMFIHPDLEIRSQAKTPREMLARVKDMDNDLVAYAVTHTTPYHFSEFFSSPAPVNKVLEELEEAETPTQTKPEPVKRTLDFSQFITLEPNTIYLQDLMGGMSGDFLTLPEKKVSSLAYLTPKVRSGLFSIQMITKPLTDYTPKGFFTRAFFPLRRVELASLKTNETLLKSTLNYLDKLVQAAKTTFLFFKTGENRPLDI